MGAGFGIRYKISLISKKNQDATVSHSTSFYTDFVEHRGSGATEKARLYHSGWYSSPGFGAG
jgi:hypothetical protein